MAPGRTANLADSAHRVTGPSRAMFAAVVLVLLGAYTVFAVGRSADRVQADEDAVVTEQALGEVSDPLAALCAEDPTIRARVGPACDTAALVASAPPESPADGLDGRDGADGLPGRDGRDGRDGVDGVTPACLSEPTMCRGGDGRDGRDGVAGQPGRDGADGSPAEVLVVNRADGTQLRCPRTGGEDVAPEYTCTAE